LKTPNKNAKVETLKPFCLVFRTGMNNDFDSFYFVLFYILNKDFDQNA